MTSGGFIPCAGCSKFRSETVPSEVEEYHGLNGSQRTIHERLWCKRSHLAGHAGEIRWALIGLSALVAEPFRSLGLSLFKLVGSLIWRNIFLDDADF